jgi:hypothetical protein
MSADGQDAIASRLMRAGVSFLVITAAMFMAPLFGKPKD